MFTGVRFFQLGYRCIARERGHQKMSAARDSKPRIYKIDPAEISAEAIGDAASILRLGGLVLYPTETFYALGAIPGIAEAVEKVFEIKGRDSGKPLPLIASDLQAVLSAASEWPESAERAGAHLLARSIEHRHSQPLRLCLPPCTREPAKSPSASLLIRVASLLAQASGGLIVSTSANKAGESPPTSPGGIATELLLSVDALLDAGDLPGGLPSAIVDVSVHPAALVRAGKIAWEEIRRALERKSEI